MAARKKNLPATKAQNTALSTTSWEERMAAMAQTAGEREPLNGGNAWLSVGNDGNFHYGDDVLGDSIDVVVLDFAFDNAYYEEAYDPDNPATPACFALSREEGEQGPHEDSPEPQADTCEECWANQFGSAERGKGKACKNSRRLAVIAVDEEQDYTVSSDSEMAFVRLAPTSLKYWKSYVSKLTRVTGLPPMGVVTNLTLHPLPKGQAGYYVQPTMVTEVENPESQGALLELFEQLGDDLLTPYRAHEEEEEKPIPRGRKKAPAKKAPAKKAPAKKAPAKKAPSTGGRRRKF